MRAAIAQIKPTLGNLGKNLEIMLKKIEEAKEKGMEVIVFPELALSGYFNSLILLATSIILFLIINWIIITREEPALIDKFGDEYLDYMKKIRRWI